MESSSKMSLERLKASGSIISFFGESNKFEEENLIDSTFPIWTTRIRGLLANVCLIASFSTIFRFIFSLGLYGSIILIPYVLLRILFGMPVILIEIMRGRYVTGPFTKIYSMYPFHMGIFICHFITTVFAITSKFLVLIRLLKYMMSLFRGRMLWSRCEKPWAGVNCYERNDNNSYFLKCMHKYNKTYCKNLNWETSGEQYWKNFIVDFSVSESFGFSVFYLSLVIACVIVINYKGIRSMEKTLTLFVIITVTLAIILNLVSYLTPGAVIGFRYIWSLNVAWLETPEIWITGMTDTVRTLSVGLLVLPFLSSHGKFTDDIYYDALTIFSSEMLCFVMAVPILSLIVTLCNDLPIFKDDFDVYIKISEIFLFYPPPKILWAFVFYLTMTILELSSQSILCLSLFEASMYILKERFTFSYLLIMIGVALFLFCIPFLFFPNLVVFSIPNLILLVIFLDLAGLEIFYGIKKFSDDFHFMMGYHPSFYFTCSLFSSTLLSFIFLIISFFLKAPQSWLQYEFYILPFILLNIYIITASIHMLKAYKKGTILPALRRNSDWGLSLPILKKSRIVFNSKTITKEYMYRQELYKKPLMKPNDFTEQNIVHLI